MTEFNTIQYCIDNIIPCFTFPMTMEKKVNVKWKDITKDTFMTKISKTHNGFAIITGGAYIVIDFDTKHNPPIAIYDALFKACLAVEKTPGGFHFWFKNDIRTRHIKSDSNIKWDNTKVMGLDIRGTGGIIYTHPSHYKGNDGADKIYSWTKGNLSTASEIPAHILESILTTNTEAILMDLNDTSRLTAQDDTITVQSYVENDTPILKLVVKSRQCLVKKDYEHSSEGHSCIYIKKLKKTYRGTATCFSHGSRKLENEVCQELVDEYWPDDATELCDEYEHRKVEFEKHNFKVLDPVGFYTCIDGVWKIRDRTQMKTAYENLSIESVLFIDKWFKDPTMRTYNSTGFYPNLAECPENIFNLFNGFRSSKLNASGGEESLDSILYHVRVLMNYNEECVEYFLDWLADILQNPSRINGKAVIINGQHGCGKDMFLGWFGEKIVGMDYTFRTAKPDRDLFDTFNMARMNKMFIHIEEANRFVMDNMNAEVFKNMITDPYCSIRMMRTDNTQNIRNFNRFALSTNNKDPIPIATTERRYFAVKASSKYCNDMDYFKRLSSAMNNEGVQSAFYKFLMDRDLRGRDWIKTPITDYLKEAKVVSLPNIYFFLHSYIDEKVGEVEETAREFYIKYTGWSREANMKVMNERDFGMSLKDIEGITKERRNSGNKCIVNCVKLRIKLDELGL